MKSVLTNFHPLNSHFTTHGQDPPKKRANNPMAKGINKFNLRFRIACTWERHKTMGGNVFLIHCHATKGGNHSKDKLARFGNSKI
jgi:hypothetical protein